MGAGATLIMEGSLRSHWKGVCVHVCVCVCVCNIIIVYMTLFVCNHLATIVFIGKYWYGMSVHVGDHRV